MDSIDFDLELLYEAGQFASVDYFFARTVSNAFSEKNALAAASCAFLSKALSSGHVCLDFNRFNTDPATFDSFFDIPVRMPDLQEWLSAVQSSSLVSSRTDTPLVLDKNKRLYLGRYYDFQSRLVQALKARSHPWPSGSEAAAGQPSPSDIAAVIEALFSPRHPHAEDQVRAVEHVFCHPLTIISGGPGTGKTHVTRMIRAAVQAFFAGHRDKDPVIICTAPTGKAASRMEAGRTIHSLLRPLYSRPGFFFNRTNPLSADLVIIDEASMIDMALLTRLIEAIPDHARVVVLGDTHQLSSVQAGSVFADICRSRTLSEHTFELSYNFRSQGKTGIEKLARAVNVSDYDAIDRILTGGEYTDIEFIPCSHQTLNDVVESYAVPGFSRLFHDSSVEEKLHAMDDFKILCAVNSGPYGTLSINHFCENILRSQGNSDISQQLLKRVIMIRNNDYKKGLFNGDCGIVTGDGDKEKAVFKNLDEGIRTYRTTDLPGHDTAFAITVHKSQGSEFKTVLMVIPDRLSPVLTRQLLYTGITRARQKVIFAGHMDIIKQAAGLSITRMSGLTDGLDLNSG